MWIPLTLGFVAGILSLALAEIGIALFFVKRLTRPRHRPSQRSPSLPDTPSITVSPPHMSLEEDMWVAIFPTSATKSDVIKHFAQKKKKDSADFELVIGQHHVKLENNNLTISFDNDPVSIDMRECRAYSVSAGKEISRKWAKKYPIMLESDGKEFSFGGSFLLLYFDTSWSKETWCQILRAASRWTSSDEDWYINCKGEFHEYSQGVHEAYPDFWKPCKETGKDEEENSRVSRNAESLSRRQRLWRKIVKNKPWRGMTLFSKEASGSVDAKTHLLEFKSSVARTESLQPHLVREFSVPERRAPSISSIQLESEKTDSSSTFSKHLESMASQTIPVLDQGTLCWNILFSRLFFDAYHSEAVREACHRLVQKQLSKIVVPGYMTGINLTKIDLGTKPPFIHSMQAHPRCPDYIWSFDAAVEYNGSAYVKLETRLNVRDYLLQESVANHRTSANFTADLLQKGLENFQTDPTTDTSEKVNNAAGSNSTKGGWKSAFARFADQVPITLTMRLVSLRGTLKVQIKPPPTDHIWFAFTSMPTIELKPEPSIGDHKITTAPVVAFISNKIKMLIEEILVLPNCEGIWIPWMFSEHDDWVPQQGMPVTLNALGVGELGLREEHHLNKEVSHKEDVQHNEIASTTCNIVTSGEPHVCMKRSTSSLSNKSSSSPELVEPFFQSPSITHDADISVNEAEALSSSSSSTKSVSQDEGTPDMKGKATTRTKMMTLGRKFTEKLDEKRRIVAEKVEKVREKYELPGK